MQIKTIDHKALERYGGKGMHLELLKNGGFKIPETYHSTDLPQFSKLRGDVKYIVRSSSQTEDSFTKTNAGIFISIPNVDKKDLPTVIKKVSNGEGNSVIQQDLTNLMEYSGVAYSNLNGTLTISLGKGSSIQGIVKGDHPETEIFVFDGRYEIKGMMTNPKISEGIVSSILEVERYFGIPVDIEFAILKGEEKPVFLQARPLPNPTASALKEHEIRLVHNKMNIVKSLGVEELIFGIGNDREILGDDKATALSTSIFTSIFSGDGKSTLGAFQLGRNDLGYDIGNEIYPSTVMVGGKVYYNFAGAALQFRPKGISIEEIMTVINKVYVPMVRGNPDLLNYPELGLFVQFPQQAIKVGLDPKPYSELIRKIGEQIGNIVMPEEIPRKRSIPNIDTVEGLCSAIEFAIDDIRNGSAKDYVKAARFAFFSLEALRIDLEELQKNNAVEFDKLASQFGIMNRDITKLRDAIAYDESIASFQLERNEEFRYLGSFELSLGRSFPPERTFRKGKEIAFRPISESVTTVRKTLEYREKMKFYLFRDYDYLKQLCDNLGMVSNYNEGIYNLDISDLKMLYHAPVLVKYRMEIKKQVRRAGELFSDPIFGSELRNASSNRTNLNEPKLIFGSIPEEGLNVRLGQDAITIRLVDQTINIPHSSKVIFVQDNIKPGSHLFTLLSDFGIPVIALPSAKIKTFEDSSSVLRVTKDGNNVIITGN